MASGEMTPAEFTAFLETAFKRLKEYSIDGSLHYLCMDWRHMTEITTAGQHVYAELKNLCVWNKASGGMGALYRSKHELIFIYKNGTAPHINNVELGRHGRYRTNVWDYAGVNSFGGNRNDLELHPTVKPVAMVADAIMDVTNRGDWVLDSFLGSGSISLHEAGAIEAGGHKILTIPQKNGKISAQDVAKYMDAFNNDANNAHMVQPRMVFVSHPTEYGTLYTKKELTDLSAACRKNNLLFYLDGARLGYALAAKNTDVTLETIARVCDVFYIGGTKVGALFGEAVVFAKPGLVEHFFTFAKQHGALLGKGRLLGIQFDTLFSDNLYFDISRHAIDMAEKLKDGLIKKGYKLFIDSPTNQQFVILDNKKMKQLERAVSFCFWEAADSEHTVVRFATSWATQEKDVDRLLELL